MLMGKANLRFQIPYCICICRRISSGMWPCEVQIYWRFGRTCYRRLWKCQNLTRFLTPYATVMWQRNQDFIKTKKNRQIWAFVSWMLFFCWTLNPQAAFPGTAPQNLPVSVWECLCRRLGCCEWGVPRWRLSRGEKEWNDGRGEFSDSVLPSWIPLHRMAVAALFLVPFPGDFVKLFVGNSNSKKELETSTEIMVFCSYVSEEHIAPIFRVTGLGSGGCWSDWEEQVCQLDYFEVARIVVQIGHNPFCNWQGSKDRVQSGPQCLQHLHLHLHIYIYIYTFTFTHLHLHIYIYIYTFTFTFTPPNTFSSEVDPITSHWRWRQHINPKRGNILSWVVQ